MGTRLQDLGVLACSAFGVAWLSAPGFGQEGALYPGLAFLPDRVATRLADHDGDGTLDLLLLSSADQTAEFRRGHGDGTFGEPVISPVESFFQSVVGDLDGDGIPDLVTGNPSPVGEDLFVIISLGRGDGTFFEFNRYRIDDTDQALCLFTSIESGDFNADGLLDIAVAISRHGGMVGPLREALVLTSEGGGSFAPPAPLGLDGELPRRLASGDLDGDGDDDLVVSLTDGDSFSRYPLIAILMANGEGGFASPDLRSVGGGAKHVAIADVNGDTAVDIAVGLESGRDVAILFGESGGPFSSPVLAGTQAGVSKPWFIDLDHDGIKDLAIGTYDGFVFMRGAGAGAFESREFLQTVAGVEDIGAIADMADLDGDGHIDFVGGSGGYTHVMRGNGDRTFRYESAAPVTGRNIRAVAAADLNMDGRVDLVSACELGDIPGEPGELTLHLGIGDGRFADPSPLLVGEGPVDVLVADFNGDGIQDLAVADRPAEDDSELIGLSILAGDGVGGFEHLPRASLAHSAAALATADFNSDGLADIAAANFLGQTEVLLGLGGGAFAPAGAWATGAGGSDIVAVDLNKDGHADLIVANELDDDISVLLGQGDGTFAPQARYQVGDAPTRLSLADVDVDGNLDVLVSNREISLLMGSGDGAFAPEIRIDIEAAGATLADLDGDSFPDLVTTGGPVVSVSRGRGTTTFDAPSHFRTIRQSHRVQAARIDADTTLDLVVIPDSVSRRLSVLLNERDLAPACVADLAAPLGTLDSTDVLAFVVAFMDAEPLADLAQPLGVHNFDDVLAFIGAFAAGCP